MDAGREEHEMIPCFFSRGLVHQRDALEPTADASLAMAHSELTDKRMTAAVPASFFWGQPHLATELSGCPFRHGAAAAEHVHVLLDDGTVCYPHDDSATGAEVAISAPPTTRQRWKPNVQQLTVLERHFSAGFTKPSPELHAAVQAAGSATEAQVAVWLKNRLARSKRALAAARTTVAPLQRPGVPQQTDLDPTSFAQKRIKRSVPTRNNFSSAKSGSDILEVMEMTLNEVSQALCLIPATDIRCLITEIVSREKVCCYAVGRERCVFQALVVRLRQLGLDAYLVGDMIAPVVGPKDLLLASAGPSFYNTVNAICLAGMRAKARVIVLTSHPTAPVPFAETVIRIPAPHVPYAGCNLLEPLHLENSEIPNMQRFLPLGSAYESTLWLFFESVAFMIQQELGVSEHDMLLKSGNLE